MDYGIVVNNDFTSFSDDEKLNYSLKLALSRLQTELKRAWYQEPKDFAPKGPETIYKNKIPTYDEIKDYYLIDTFCTVNGVSNTSVVTNVTVGKILNNANNESGYDFSKIINTSRDNSDNITDLSQPAPGISKLMFTRYRYWENGLTGKYSAIDGTVGSASEGTYNNETEPENAIMSYVGGQLNSARTWKSYNDNLGGSSSEALFFTKLTTYSSPIKIIDPSNVTVSYTHLTLPTICSV